MTSLWCALPLTSCARDDRHAFDRVIEALRADFTGVAAMTVNDAHVRRLYQQEVTRLARALEQDAIAGRLSWQAAAQRAQALRNDVMSLMRGRTSPVGRALAEYMKRNGLTRETLLARYSERLFGRGASFTSLDAAQQARVHAEIVAAAGRANPQVNAMLARWSQIGRGVIVVSLAISVYTVVVDDAPGKAALREGALLGAGIGGGVAGGAAAGLLCGPGAPLCVTVGAFVGGALAAFGVGAMF
ncbi:hypothetical protein [Roseinatronobacter monicus]|uniref:Uncharacterized protein n=1 Tax=Roseinatronobacter monicus TaxID=393481 RepID=A0A543K4E9_9RHOB|nr:hypothetical protein [Roseinatronobacter monicus]TQM89959.1 hypothetical protein BD293_4278 [Roseinatronobacter monicus]